MAAQTCQPCLCLLKHLHMKQHINIQQVGQQDVTKNIFIFDKQQCYIHDILNYSDIVLSQQ